MADIDQTGIPYSQYAAAYQQVYGTAPPLSPGYAQYYAQNPNAIYTQQFGGTQGQIPISTLMAIANNKSGGGGAAASGGGAAGTSGSQAGQGSTTGTSTGTQSYLGGTGMATYSTDPRSQQNFMLPNGSALSPAQTQQVMDLYQQYEGGNAAAGQALVQWTQGMGMSTDQLNASVNNLRSGAGPNAPPQMTSTTQPETVGLQQMAQIDPTSEALRQQLGQSYLSSLQNAPTGAPQAADVQSYLDLYKQIDPEGYAQRTGLATSMDAYLQQAQQEAALGSTLDDATRREVEQATRAGQSARGNIYGTPQLVEEAMSRGTAGEARRQQRQQALAGALGGQQSYLSAGLGIGDVGNALYQQGYARNLAQRQQAQQAATGWLGSGSTPYQAGASYLQNAENRAATAAQGGPQYNPASLGQSYGASQLPQYGLDIGAQAQNYYNSLSAGGYGGGAATKNKGAAAASGALSGAIGGATAGTAIYPGVGTAIGAVAGGVLGGAGGYFS